MTGHYPVAKEGLSPLVREYLGMVVHSIVTDITPVPLAQGEETARLSGYPFAPMVG